MLPTKVFGLPAHVLLVHAVVVLIPLTCAAVVLHAAWPAARRRLGIVTPALAAVSLALMPVTTNAGDYLERHITVGPPVQRKIEHHEALGRQLIWYVIGLLIVSIAVWALGRLLDGASVPFIAPASKAARTVPSWVTIAAVGVSIALAVATTVQLYRIGDTGAHAVWDGVLH